MLVGILYYDNFERINMSSSFDRLEGVEARLRELEGRSFVTDPNAQSEYWRLSQERRDLRREVFPEPHFTPSPIYPNRDLWDHP